MYNFFKAIEVQFQSVLVAWSKYCIQGVILMAVFLIIINTIIKVSIFSRLTGKPLQMSVYVVYVSSMCMGMDIRSSWISNWCTPNLACYKISLKL
jgi:hypothetical protein